ncbi:GatB/YqeY domain-containing protein [Psychroflexus sp. CAK57W]|uniref:GatB/YqeY domain-containing protein n=1 Tax=Psychroflexus curvus TaxID=2873595 RepID=UPI001CCB5C43|nr:GatB/YqeY domain-containing protein [Psychroflexus curvus]MBZ9627911.1 GatB/YqeY domain-containing protein [Psychroflexus curvus]MBZ9787588.1 GatB/YqeY domain-containing protein [Psychroflexus curvus]
MALEQEVMQKMKEAMKAKDSVALASLRSIKSEILKAKTATSSKDEIPEAEELKLVQKLVKQRKDSADLYLEQDRKDLAEAELAEAKIIEQFLPAQLSEEEIDKEVKSIVEETGASSMKDMGKVMGMASQRLAGRADGKTISKIVKGNLS